MSVGVEGGATDFMSILAIIPAHNEAAILDETLTSLCSATPPPDGIIVLADHCTDATRAVATQNGAIVFQRETGEGGKGPALRWLFAQHPAVLMRYTAVVILDADSRVNPLFFQVVKTTVEQGTRAAQSFVQPVDIQASTASALAAYSELLSQLVDERVRARLGWSVRLRGTGMVFTPHLLAELLKYVHTRSEDIELTLLLADRRERVLFLPQAVVYDTKPPNATQISRQRARWLQGQFQVYRAYGPMIGRLTLRGPAMWWMLLSTLFRPRTLYIALVSAVFGLTLVLPVNPIVRWLMGLLLLGDMVYYLVGLLAVPMPERQLYARALLRAPLFVWVWVASLVTAWRFRQGWLSVRHK